MRQLINGAPSIKGIKGFVSISMLERFWQKVQLPNDLNAECWTWTGATDGRYGQLWGRGKKVRAHRFSWELHNGMEIPNDLQACHTCDNPACVNPNHIFIGTASQNILDASVKGKLTNRGWRSRLTHCKQGHEFTKENTYRYANEHRMCRACKKIQRINRERRRLEAKKPIGGDE